MTDRPDLTPREYDVPADLTPAFNAVADDACELEIKFLVPEIPDDPNNPASTSIDPSVFPRVRNYFHDLGWIRSEVKNYPLMTRQLDTPDRALFQKGVTLRIRGNCKDADLSHMNDADICVKLGKSEDTSGAVRRDEFETRINNFQRVSIKPLLDKYPADTFPQLHTALDGVKPNDLREFFRIDCIRNRCVLEVPESETGLTGKRYFAELIMDEVRYVLDIPGMKQPMVFHTDLEIECEKLSKPCSYDHDPKSKNYYSSPMTAAETDQAMAYIRDKIQEAAGNHLEHNTISKAERGFHFLDRTLAELGDLVEANEILPRKKAVQHAYSVNQEAAANDNGKPHHRLNRDFGPYIRHAIAPIAKFSFTM